MLVVLTLLGCGNPPQPLTSSPTDPSADLTAPLASKPRWAKMDGFFPPRPGLPVGAPGLDVGMSMDAAQAQMNSLSLARAISGNVAGRQVHSITFKAAPDVALAAVADESGTKVHALQFTLPAAEGERALIDQWGEPDGITLEPGLPTDYIWTDATHTIRWTTFPNRSNGMLHYEAKTPSAGSEADPQAPQLP